ncbi:MAG: hypothetical protein KDC35_20380 [Acidobacteria bacterium]|nr:hypothetical protein [Acidobacteriota bacterium]
MIYLAWLALLFSDKPFTNMQPWDELARPWMTAAEETLFDALDENERLRFRGTFVARRQEHPGLFSDQGLFLPQFFCERTYGDIRDYIVEVLGEPESTTTNPSNSLLPSEWHFADYEFHFIPIGRNRVTLTERSVTEWDRLKNRMILHPQILYSFDMRPFGRTRIPDQITWYDTRILTYLLDPDPRGELLRVAVALTPSFREAVQSKGREDVVLELLITLDKGVGEVETRHDATAVNLQKDDAVVFEVHMPPGHFNADLKIFSGFLTSGLKTSSSIYVAPPTLPRVGTPIIVQQWAPEGLIKPDKRELMIGGFRYRWDQPYDPSRLAMVLVHAAHLSPEALMIKEDDIPRPLSYINRAGDWFMFELPPQQGPFRVMAQTLPDAHGLRGFRTFPADWTVAIQDSSKVVTNQTDNYLELETLTLKAAGPELYVCIGGHPFLSTSTGEIPWPPFDWGPTTQVDVRFLKDGTWSTQSTVLSRTDVFTEISVRNPNLVAAARHVDGSASVPPDPFYQGQQLADLKHTSIHELNQIWGIAIHEDVVNRGIWPFLREELVQWFKSELKPGDLTYIVRSGGPRTRLALAPTSNRAEWLSALKAVTPTHGLSTNLDFSVLLEEVTHLEYHTTMPHHLILITDHLTEDLTQLEAMLVELRQTGLHVYHLEFPRDAPTTATAKSIADRALDMDSMQPDRDATRDSFQEDRNTQVGFRISMGDKKRMQNELDQREKEAAARRSFAEQLQFRTAGLGMSADVGEERQEISEFFRQLTDWTHTLVFIELPANIKADDVVFQNDAATQVYWTTVDWGVDE